MIPQPPLMTVFSNNLMRFVCNPCVKRSSFSRLAKSQF
jgi:hypothetical protein